VNAHEISGSATSGALCGMPNVFTVYFDAQFDRDFSTTGTWQNDRVSPGGTDASGPQSGGYVHFDASANPTVKVKVSVSYVSVEGARRNIAAEGTTWNLGAVRARAATAWRRALGRITTTGGTRTERTIFYTALYHAFLHPNIFNDADGRYRGFDGTVHAVAAGHAHYANFSDWDTYRTQTPLMALLVPHEMSDMVQSLVDDARQGGSLPRWPLANDYTGVMAGDSEDPLIAGAYAFGARDFDRAAALAAMVHGATEPPDPKRSGWFVERPGLDEYVRHGYVVNVHTTSVSPVPNGASETLEYALDDFSIARFAHALGAASTERTFMHRSQNWSRLFDRDEGLVLPRDADGAFIHAAITPNGQSGFQEGNAWQYTWMVPQNLGGLVEALGGRQATVAKLDRFFTQLNAGQSEPYAWFGNEPSIGSPWVYLYAGAPAHEEQVVRRVMRTLYRETPDGLPGNDDLGTMSAWYVWNALGLYPVSPSVPLVLVGSPLFSQAVVTSEDGRRIIINAPHAGDDRPFVLGLRVNGHPTNRSWVDLPRRGTLALDFLLGAQPSARWGVAKTDVPPSYGNGPLVLPPATSATFVPPPSITIESGGAASIPLDVTAANGPIAWTAAGPPAIGIVPAHGTFSGAAQAVLVSAGPATPPGLYDITIAGRAANGALLASVPLVVRVTHGNAAAPLGYIANFVDSTVTAIDPRTRAFSAPITVGRSPGGLALSPDGRHVYIANQGSANVSVIDAATNAVTATIPVGTTPAGIRVSPDGRTVWVANYSDGTAQAIDVATNVASAPITVGPSPEGVAISPDSHTVYVVNNGNNTLTPIDARTHTAGAPIAVGRRPLGIAISPDGRALYVSNMEGNSVTVVRTVDGGVVTTIPVGKTPQGLSVSPDGALVYVTNSASSSVTPIDTKTLRAGAPIPVGDGPFDVAFSADGKTAYVVDTADNDWLAIDVATASVTARIAAGSFPIAIALPASAPQR
jgi:predicted alpha-1,2-mannosidase